MKTPAVALEARAEAMMRGKVEGVRRKKGKSFEEKKERKGSEDENDSVFFLRPLLARDPSLFLSFFRANAFYSAPALSRPAAAAAL